MDEFSRIARFFAPLAVDAGAFGLKDDAAQLRAEDYIITQDTLVEGVHFVGDEPPARIAQKALRVNLSDLAAKGAEPAYYFLSLSLPTHKDDVWLEGFAEGLRQDQETFGITLMGGDSTTSKQGVVITITALGKAKRMITRSGAQAGDALFITGSIGEAYVGLESLRAGGEATERYLLPQPRLSAIPLIRQYATACLDVSDGLLQDLLHLCTASHVKAEMALDAIPAIGEDVATLLELATGGDDYELLFTAQNETEVMLAASQASLPITRIGTMTEGAGISLTFNGKSISLPERLGYQHAL